MLDWRNAMEASDYRRDVLLFEAEQDRVVMEADRAREDQHEVRPPLIGLFVAAMMALVATGAIPPR